MRDSGNTSEIPHAELVGRAAELREDLWKNAPESDGASRLSDELLARVTGAGLTGLLTPRKLGGHETGVRTLLEVCVELGRGCCSTAWVTGVLNVGNFVVSLYPDRTREEVWAEHPDARTALILGAPVRTVEKADGGVRVVGEWPYASGSLHADWIGGLVLADTGTGLQPHMALMPASDVTVRDTWHFVGMRATGSNTVVADGVFVPEHRLLPYGPLLAGKTDGLVPADRPYRNSLTGVFMVGLVGSMIGGASAALDYALTQAPTRRVAGSTYTRQADSPAAQLGLAAAATALDTAVLHARRLADSVDALAAAGENPSVPVRARARMDATHVVQQCRTAVEEIVSVYGSSAFDESNPLQRIWRDVNVGSRHAGFGMGIPEQAYGTALVGNDPRTLTPML
ncbi:acyl-CoA dehydrogenase family protein [Streptomyces sp. AM 2-1-1]|uniref:acyl-CoA dehydrogenase family protein n=1 Tax=Streptomyces sp. AM 2-1-1 TaxID=3028709 RepID=UPI0023BA2CB1|nr:acyl-CoA dehydrogenase family protein [Streptomyces sp. AM 2-1-1]WEH39152.1 acyl-CoA dehydrogenase family protein [Streptomyces sp. AM 2-1-1]